MSKIVGERIHYVFGTDFKRKKNCYSIDDQKSVHVDSRLVRSNNVIMLKMIAMMEYRRIPNISSCSFGTIHRIIHTELTIKDAHMPDGFQKMLNG